VNQMSRTSFAALQQRIDAAKRKCTTGYSCGAGCISMKKQCRKNPSAGPGQQKMKRVLALAAGKEGGSGMSGGAQQKALPPAGGSGGAQAAKEKPAKGKPAKGKPAAAASGKTGPMTTQELRSPVLKYFGVRSADALLKNKNFQHSILGDDSSPTFKGPKAADEWRQMYRRFIAVPRDERGQKEGGSVINGIDVMKNFRPWVVFGLDPKKASKGDVDKAFRKLALKHHPDVGGDRKVFEKLLSMKNSVKALMDSALQARIDALIARCGV